MLVLDEGEYYHWGSIIGGVGESLAVAREEGKIMGDTCASASLVKIHSGTTGALVLHVFLHMPAALKSTLNPEPHRITCACKGFVKLSFEICHHLKRTQKRLPQIAHP